MLIRSSVRNSGFVGFTVSLRSKLGLAMWQCSSTMPGMMVESPHSTLSYPDGTAISDALPIASILPFFVMTTPSKIGGELIGRIF